MSTRIIKRYRTIPVIISLAVILSVLSIRTSLSQVVVTIPAYAVDQDSCEVIFDAAQGNQGLIGFSGAVYAHTGVITNLSTAPSDWKYVIAEWNVNVSKAQLVPLGNNRWKLRVIPSIRAYYGVPEGETIEKMAFVFRNSDGSRTGRNEDGSDIFADVYPAKLSVNIIQPGGKELLVTEGESIPVEAGSPFADTMMIFRGETLLKKVAGTSVTDTLIATLTSYWERTWIRVVAKNDTAAVADSFAYRILPDPPVAELPQGIADGINYIDTATVVLCLYAPFKSYCFAIGDFSGWEAGDAWYMNRTPDGNRYWIQLSGLTPRQEYRFQYFVDGTLRFGDPYADKVCDPDDQYISPETYPGLLPYPSGLTTGIATVFQTGQEPYNWQITDFSPPEVKDLVVYELLIRDFTSQHTFQSVIDTLGYLKRLGVNAIELMPIMEFEGNISWGYNPNYAFAVDKYYGPKNSFKQLVDAAHEQGMAVILDIVCNHHFGSSPLVQLYWNTNLQRPAADNPWFNEIPTHPYNVGYDFNHESADTRVYMERLIRYWIEEYHVDGYRFDLSKGFTQVNSYPNNVALWGQYDASRIDILKHYRSVIHGLKSDAYVILEHFADNSEEKVLAADSMILWGNLTYNYGEAAKGFNTGTNADFSWISYKKRGWSEPHVIGYMESHDEERMMFKCISAGNNSAPPYLVKDTNTALKRAELAACFFFTVPGPKMIWQFEEIGYDYSINWPSGTNNSRLDPKPVRWDYTDEWRRQYTFNVFSALAGLKKSLPVFTTEDFTITATAASKRITLRHASMDVVVLGNFDVKSLDVVPEFTRTGRWYEFFSGDSLEVTAVNTPIPFEAGEYRLYTTVRLPKPLFTGMEDMPDADTPGNMAVKIYPNPNSGRFHAAIRLHLDDHVIISLTDLTGRETIRLFSGELRGGLHTIPFNLEEASGYTPAAR